MPEKKKPPVRKFNRTIHIKVDEQTSATLERLSDEEDRSVTNVAQRLIKSAVDALAGRRAVTDEMKRCGACHSEACVVRVDDAQFIARPRTLSKCNGYHPPSSPKRIENTICRTSVCNSGDAARQEWNNLIWIGRAK